MEKNTRRDRYGISADDLAEDFQIDDVKAGTPEDQEAADRDKQTHNQPDLDARHEDLEAKARINDE